MLVNLRVKVSQASVVYCICFITFHIDYYTNVLLVDESGEEISCNLFSSNPSLLPKITSVGDILRLHRLKVENRKQAM